MAKSGPNSPMEKPWPFYSIANIHCWSFDIGERDLSGVTVERREPRRFRRGLGRRCREHIAEQRPARYHVLAVICSPSRSFAASPPVRAALKARAFWKLILLWFSSRSRSASRGPRFGAPTSPPTVKIASQPAQPDPAASTGLAIGSIAPAAKPRTLRRRNIGAEIICPLPISLE